MFFNQIKSFLRDYFTLTSRERKGALVLASIIFIQIIALVKVHYLTPPDEPLITTYRMELLKFERKFASEPTSSYKYTKPEKNISYFYFDPNSITDHQWMELGLSERQTKLIRNYLNKGGRFRDKESFAKIYSISPEMYEKLKPWILIPEKSHEKKDLPATRFSSSKKISIMELNTADTTLLTTLPLIGPGRSRMIFKYRERLGGFISEDQLLEVFTMDTAALNAIRPFIHIDSMLIRKVNFNSDTLNHPYLGKRTAAAIIAYRKQHGKFVDINALRKVAVLEEQMWLKVAPYAVFE